MRKRLEEIRNRTALRNGENVSTSEIAANKSLESAWEERLIGLRWADRPGLREGSWAGATTNYVGNPKDPNLWTNYWPHGGIHFYA